MPVLRIGSVEAAASDFGATKKQTAPTANDIITTSEMDLFGVICDSTWAHLLTHYSMPDGKESVTFLKFPRGTAHDQQPAAEFVEVRNLFGTGAGHRPRTFWHKNQGRYLNADTPTLDLDGHRCLRIVTHDR